MDLCDTHIELKNVALFAKSSCKYQIIIQAAASSSGHSATRNITDEQKLQVQVVSALTGTVQDNKTRK